MKLAAFTRYGALGASSRVRLLQYLPALRATGISVQALALFDDEYLLRKYAGAVPWPRVARAYAARAREAGAAARRADVLWIEKELWPWAPAWLERAAWRDKPVLLDYDDAIFHNYDLHPSLAVRRLYGGKIDGLMHHASMVVAGNDYLAERARRAGAARVEILPTVIDLDRYAQPERTVADASAPVVVGWIGSPATVGYLQALAEPLARVAVGRAIELRVIGAPLALPGVVVTQVPWSETGEVQALRGCDIGIMPLPDSPWERGKCGYKLVQYMACGLPVVASPVGINARIVAPGVNGFLATSPAQWEQALVQLADDPALRQRLGQAGRALVETRYSLQVAAPRLANWLHELAAPAPPRKP